MILAQKQNKFLLHVPVLFICLLNYKNILTKYRMTLKRIEWSCLASSILFYIYLLEGSRQSRLWFFFGGGGILFYIKGKEAIGLN